MAPTCDDLERLYRNRHRDTLNSDAEFWNGVALRLGRLEFQRAASARRVAEHARLLARTAAERDAVYRAQIEALKAR